MTSPKTCPKGSTVLVAGANGFVASHIVDQLLQAGFKVRGTVRDDTKQTWLEEAFHKRYDSSFFSAVIVPDITVPGACDEAMRGCSGVVHTASDTSYLPNPDTVIPATVNGVKRALESAARTPSVVRFAYTGTCNAAHEPKANTQYHISKDSWNDKSLKEASAEPPHPINQGFIVYYAAKSEAEKAAWRFMREKKPTFTFNSVLLNLNIGPVLIPEHPSGSGMGIKFLYENVPQLVGLFSNETLVPPQHCVDVRDTARLHVATLTEGDVENERIVAAAEQFNFNYLVKMMKSFAPEGKAIPEEVEGLAQSMQTVDDGRSVELLKRFGRPGWSPVRDAMRENCL